MKCSLRALFSVVLAVFLIVPAAARADLTIISDFMQNGGVFTLSPPGDLFVENSVLTFSNSATTAGIVDVYAGYFSPATIDIYGGSTVYSGDGYIGYEYGNADYPWTVSRANLTGAGSQWHNERLFVGYGGAGILNVQNGALVSTNDLAVLGVSVEWSEGYGTGTAVVSGVGSRWQISGDLYLSELASSTLRIENGGRVTSTNTYATGHPQYFFPGVEDFGSSDITVTGTGSTWQNDNLLYIGIDGPATLNVLNGGKVSNNFGYIYSNGTSNVTGPNAKWENTGNLEMRGLGGTLNVSEGGEVTAKAIFASLRQLQGDGSISTKGVVLDADLRFDRHAQEQQTLNFGNGGRLHFNLDGTASLGVGYHETGTLLITDGVQISSLGAYLGYYSGSQGTGDVIGTGSQWSNGWMDLGLSGSTGVLNIVDGGAVVTGDSAGLGYVGGTGTVSLAGIGSNWAVTNQLHIGRQGRGTLNVMDGGVVTSNVGNLGQETGSTGVATIIGSGSAWEVGSDLFVGIRGTGTLNISNGGVVTNNQSHVGHQAGGIGTVTVSGTDSLWQNNGDLHVGHHGTGTLNIANGGVVTSEMGYLGRGAAGARGTVTVEGAGSLWQIGSELQFRQGTVDVHEAGMVVIGDATGELGAVVVGKGGTLFGSINIIGDLVVDGGVVLPQDWFDASSGAAPMNAVGVRSAASDSTMTIDGNFTLAAEGVLILGLGESTKSSGPLVISGDLTLVGLVQFDLLDGFVPQMGDQFQFFAVGGTTDLSGLTYEWLNVPAGFHIDATLLDGTLTITAVPEPSSLILAGIGMTLATIIGVRRRRAKG